MEESMLSSRDAAAYTGISYFTLEKRRGQKVPPVFLKRGGRAYYRVSDLDNWLRSRPRGQATDPSYIGKQFGRLTVVRVGDGRIHKAVPWVCRCECGTVRDFPNSRVRSGRIQSCGCISGSPELRERISQAHIKHGHNRTSLGAVTSTYRIWQGIKGRCHNPRSPYFKYYGARGIVVCERWHSFENFLADVGERPVGLSLDRIDNDGPYSPDNCRWATMKQQSRNKRDTVWLTIDGVTAPRSEWAEKYGVDVRLVTNRMHEGWDALRALTTPRRVTRALRGRAT